MPALSSHTIEDHCCNGYGRCGAVSVWVFPSRQHSRLVSNFPSLHNIMEDSAVTSSAHTPGPWAVFGIKTDAPFIHTVKDGPAGVMVAIVSKEWGTEREKEANAQLIAAAPDLLDACKITDSLLSSMPVEDLDFQTNERLYEIIQVVPRAIGTAKGR